MKLLVVALLALTLGGSAAAYDPYTGDIYVVSVAGGGRHALTDAPEQEYFPALSPNGRRIAYVRDAEPDPQLWLMNSDGSGQHRLTSSPGEKLRPVWSPDGSRIAFMVWNRSLCEPEIVLWCPFTDIWTIRPDGSGERKLASRAMQPAWSRDGKRPLPEEIEPVDPSTATRPEAAIESREVFAYISALPESFRDALVAVDIVGLSYGEAAKLLGTKEATITSRLYRARAQVARGMDPTRESVL